MLSSTTTRGLFACTTLILGIAGSTPASADLIYSESFEQETNIGQYWDASNVTSYSGAFGNFLGRFGNKTVRLEIESAVTGGAFAPPAGQDNHVTPIDAKFEQGYGLPDQGNEHGEGGDRPNVTYPSLELSNSGKTEDNGLYNAGTYALTFDLFLFDSWDWSYEAFGPDGVAVAINGVTLFDELFDSHYHPNNFRLPDEVPGSEAGNNAWNDMIFRDIEIRFTTHESMESFAFDFIGTPNQSLNDESWGIDNVRVSTISRAAGIPAPGGVALLTGGLVVLSKRRR